MAVTMRDVADLAGVSVKTVSNVLNDYPYIRPATRDRVLEAVDRLGYRLNTSARNLRRGRTGLISLALPQLALRYFAELADEIIDAAEAHGLRVLIERTGAVLAREREVLRDSVRMGDGLILNPLGLGQEHEPELPDDVPLVLLGEHLFSERFDHVTMQNVAAARAATTYLLERGRRRVAVLGVHPGEAVGSAALRLRGHLAALEDAGIAPDLRLQGEATSWHRDTGARAMAQVLDAGARPDAVLAFNDALALGALHELQARGIGVPDDVAVIGWDDIEEAQYATPSLTTVDAGRRAIAQAAVARLVARIADPDRPVELLEMPYRIIERGSTAS